MSLTLTKKILIQTWFEKKMVLNSIHSKTWYIHSSAKTNNSTILAIVDSWHTLINWINVDEYNSTRWWG